MRGETSWVREVDEASFERDVLEESRIRPVVVDFWAPWCGPCRFLGPVLEELAERDEGRWLLAKVNTDRSQELAARYRIRGIPAVKAFRDGAEVAEFVGALPESSVREWLDRFLPGPADDAVAQGEELWAEGRAPEAEAAYHRALALRPQSYGALYGLARSEAQRDRAEAERLLDRISPDDAAAHAADVARLRLRLRGADAGDEASLRAQLEAAAEDDAARLRLGLALAAHERWEEALSVLLEVVRRDRGEPREEARRAMLEIFDAVGARSELADLYRAKLARELYK